MSVESAANSSEWTFVTRKGRRQNAKYQNKTSTSKKNSLTNLIPRFNEIKESPINEADVEKTLATIKKFRAKWAGSAQGLRLKTLLQQSLSAETLIENAIIAGLGSLDPNAIRDRLRTCWQLAVFLEMLESLPQAPIPTSELESKPGVPVYAQDPVFTSFDKTLLAKLDIVVLPGAGAVDKCTASTFLFVPFVDATILLPQILDGREPLIFVGSDIEEVAERIGMPAYAQQTEHEQDVIDKCLLIAKAFLDSRQRLAMDFNSFGELGLHGMAVFIQKYAFGDPSYVDDGE